MVANQTSEAENQTRNVAKLLNPAAKPHTYTRVLTNHKTSPRAKIEVQNFVQSEVQVKPVQVVSTNVVSGKDDRKCEVRRFRPNAKKNGKLTTLSPSTNRKNGKKNNPAFVPQNYKTEICRSHRQNGTCEYENSCQFAHGIHELRPRHYGLKYKTQECKNYHSTGFCRFGSRCKFIHDEQRIRVAEDEFWLVSPSENLVRVEVVESEVRQQELASLVNSTQSPSEIINQQRANEPKSPGVVPPPIVVPDMNVKGPVEQHLSPSRLSPTYAMQSPLPEFEISPYMPYRANGVLYGPPQPPMNGYYVQPSFVPVQSYSYGYQYPVVAHEVYHPPMGVPRPPPAVSG